MKITSSTAAFAILAGLGFCTPAPTAWAEAPTMNGTYHYLDEDGDTGTWVIRTTCSPNCVAHVTTSPNRGFDAEFADGRYTSTRVVPEGVFCPASEGSGASNHPVTVTQWWDPATLSGEVDFLDSTAPCGLADQRDRFTLTRLG